jgi:hypothetical protein
MLVAAQAPRARKDAHAVTDTRQAHVIATTICYQFKGGGRLASTRTLPHESVRKDPLRPDRVRSEEVTPVTVVR